MRHCVTVSSRVVAAGEDRNRVVTQTVTRNGSKGSRVKFSDDRTNTLDVLAAGFAAFDVSRNRRATHAAVTAQSSIQKVIRIWAPCCHFGPRRVKGCCHGR